jgi:predicted nucleotidyltransferase
MSAAYSYLAGPHGIAFALTTDLGYLCAVRPLQESVTIQDQDRDRLREAAATVFARHPEVVAAWLHGSAAGGDRAGDLDLALLLKPSAAPFPLLHILATELREEGVARPELDLRPLHGTSPRFRATVLRNGLLLYDGDPAGRVAFEARAMSEWLDFKPVWERMRGHMRERWMNG